MHYGNCNFIKDGRWVVLFRGTVFLLFGLISLIVAGNMVLQEQNYQSGECVITAQQLLSTTTSTKGNGNPPSRTTVTSTDVSAPSFE